VCILFDCGWNSKFEPSILEPLKKVAPKVQLVLLSHPDLAHLGGLVYAWKHFNLNAPILCTGAVKEMGRLCLLDALDCHLNDHDQLFDGFNEEDIENCFREIIDVKYTQKKELSKIIRNGNGEGLVLQAFNAGHLLGGAIYVIKARDTDSFVYAVDFNHKEEWHLNEAEFDPHLKPTLLITSASSAPRQLAKKDRDRQLLDLTVKTLRQQGNVLIPIDGSGRVLELVHLFEKQWSNNAGLAQYPIYLLHSVCEQTTEAAKRQIEWMNKTISANFDRTQNNPYDLKVVKTIKSLAELDEDQAAHGPKVVFASCGSLDMGASKRLFQRWCREPKVCSVYGCCVLLSLCLPTPIMINQQH
jgi:cleavage and polyadenylation specificity factor subunit 2